MKDVPAVTDLDVNFLKPFSTFFKKELNYIFLIEKVNNRQLNNKNSDNNFGELSK